MVTNHLFYEAKTGWSENDGTIEEALENIRDDGKVTIYSDETFESFRIVIGTCGDEEFTLIGTSFRPFS